MARSDDEFRFESLQDAESLTRYLGALAECFSKGKLVFRSGKKELVLIPTGLLRFDVKAKRKGERIKVSLQISWKQEDREGEDAGEPLTIETT